MQQRTKPRAERQPLDESLLGKKVVIRLINNSTGIDTLPVVVLDIDKYNLLVRYGTNKTLLLPKHAILYVDMTNREA